ncbi:MAG: hypothetical protein ACE5E6_04805, partial [Phycisphaerae bacterium]
MDGRTRFGVRAAIVAATCLLGVAAREAGAQSYTLTPLGFLPGGGPDNSWGFGVNGVGDVCGESTSTAAGLLVEAFFWQSNTITGIGSLQAIPFHTRGRDVNNADVVVGWSATPLGWQGFRWDATNLIVGLGYVGGCPSGEGQTFTSYAEGINAAGEIAGCTSTASSCAEAYIWSGGSWATPLGFLTGHVESCAYDINNAVPVQVVGQSADTSGSREAFLWDSGSGMVGLGMVTGNDESSALAVNDAGDVVGISYNNTGGNPMEATVWLTANAMAPQGLGYLIGSDTTSQAWDVNNALQVVGTSITPTSDIKAFIWDPCHGMRDLNALVDATGSGWTLWYGSAINDAGQIAGYGLNPSGQIEAYRLDPIKGACCNVPGAAGCIELTGPDCTCAGGTYQGNGTTCNPDPCGGGQVCPLPPPPAQQFCLDLQPLDCVTAGPPSGTCLPSEFQIVLQLPKITACACCEQDCCHVDLDAAGTTLFCSAMCLDPADVCQIHADGVATGLTSISSMDATYSGAHITCDCARLPIGACCLPDGTCVDNVLELDCLAQGGVFGGAGSLCQGVEACCY